jgi:transposase
MKPISSAQHSLVASLLQEGYSLRQIQSKTRLGKSTVGRIKKKIEGDKENNKGGRPSKLSAGDKRSITRQITNGSLDNAVQATQFINSTLLHPVTPQTVRNALKENDFRSVVKKKRPLLKAAHRIARLKYARYHANWTVEDWKRVLWTDETKINRIGSDGRVYTWKKKGEPISDRTTTPTVKHGGGNNLMVWGCMGWNGVGVLTEVQGIMDGQQYCEILEAGVVESFEKLEMPEGERIFQQDNDPKHRSKKADKWFEDNNINVMVWPAQSPDLNPIEHLWVELKKALKKYPRPAKGVHELWERVVEEWNKIPPETCQNLIESMPRRIQAVIKAKGGHIKY